MGTLFCLLLHKAVVIVLYLGYTVPITKNPPIYQNRDPKGELQRLVILALVAQWEIIPVTFTFLTTLPPDYKAPEVRNMLQSYKQANYRFTLVTLFMASAFEV